MLKYMALTFLLHIPQVYILSECCDRTDQSACASSGKMALLLKTCFRLLQPVIPAESEVSHRFSHAHILAIYFRHFDIFWYVDVCEHEQMYKIVPIYDK